jgi:hypothetical protein
MTTSKDLARRTCNSSEIEVAAVEQQQQQQRQQQLMC